MKGRSDVDTRPPGLFPSSPAVTVPAGVSLRGEGAGLRPTARQRGAQGHAGGEAPQRLPGEVGWEGRGLRRLRRFGSVDFMIVRCCEPPAGRHAGLRVRAGHRAAVGGGGGVRGVARHRLVLPHHLRAAPGQKVSLCLSEISLGAPFWLCFFFSVSLIEWKACE